MSDFESRLSRLESIGESLRDGSVPLNEASRLFEEGIGLARDLDKELQKIEKRVEILANVPDDESDEPPSLELFPELHDALNNEDSEREG